MVDARSTGSVPPRRDEGGPRESPALDSAVLTTLLDASRDGIVVLDGHQRCVYVNDAGCRILGEPRAALLSRPLRFGGTDPGREAASAPGRERVTALSVADGTQREVEYTRVPVDSGGRALTAVTFRDVTETRWQERRLAAFARTASSLAGTGSVQTVLDKVAAEVVEASSIGACSIILIDPDTNLLRMVGAAGHGDAYVQRLAATLDLGAPLVTLRAFTSRRPVVQRDLARIIDEDSRFGPMTELRRDARWVALAAAPLVVRDRQLGVLTAFYTEGQDPSDADVEFLTAMADQAAVAVDNARLFAEQEGRAALEERHRLARELHDSVSQALFSMTLHTRAVQLAAERAGHDPGQQVARGLSTLRALTEQILVDMRALIFQLRPGTLHEGGLVDAVSEHARSVAAMKEVNIRVEGPESRLPLSQETETEIFRVIQEALNNSVRHARPKQVEIRITVPPQDKGALVVEVCDDGAGFDPGTAHPGHLGLESMRERTERLGGRLRIHSSPAGSVVRAYLPGLLSPARRLWKVDLQAGHRSGAEQDGGNARE
ncbi:GAF domain-containing protein [Streptomyces sp. NPDC056716]|uniref:GAF domain-containing protein n=1 Tax=unclassified Streptomyces TaxID=2593676 RepID=UPI0036A03CE0